jgi:hypothetical protein
MTRIKRFYDVHEPNENFLKYGVSITSEMAFTEPLLLRKGHFLSRKRGRLFKKYFFRSLNGAFKPRKKDTFFTFKKSGGAQAPIAPPVPRPLDIVDFYPSITEELLLNALTFASQFRTPSRMSRST